MPRQVGLIWALLFFNGLAFSPELPIIVPIPSVAGKLLTQGALALALVLALTVNREYLVRPNLFLGLMTILAASSLMISIRLTAGYGSVFRAVRFIAFLGALWLVTRWWRRANLTFVRYHLRCLIAACGTVVLGALISPGGALQVDGRLSGRLWPIQPPQVAHYAAVAAGIAFVLWLAGALAPRAAALIVGGGLVLVLLTETRTAMFGLIAGVVVATLNLLVARRRARRAVGIALIVVPLGLLVFAPAASEWFSRGQSREEISQLTGRTKVWDLITAEHRSGLARWFGSGLSNKSFNGLPIDNSWYAVYVEQGIFGDLLVALAILSLLVSAVIRPPGWLTAVALFLVVYCIVASFTETGQGDASPYLLDLALAASLLVPAVPEPGRSRLEP